MNTYYFGIFLLLINLSTSNIFGAATEYSQKFRDQDPYFYAVIADAAYHRSLKGVQAFLDKKLGAGKATAMHTNLYRQSLYGDTNIILVKDDKNRLHVGFEGSTDTRNWLRNLKSSAIDVESDVLTRMHNEITSWEKTNWPGTDRLLTLASICGHSQGGMYASQIVHKFYKHYTQPLRTKSGKIDSSKRQGRATVVTFNSYKPKKDGFQFHFATENEHGSTLFSSKGRYIPIKHCNNHASIKSNHGMKPVRRGLKDKSWSDFKKYNDYIK